MSKRKPTRPALVRAGAGEYRLNQHADRHADRRTRRNRDRSAQRRRAISDAS